MFTNMNEFERENMRWSPRSQPSKVRMKACGLGQSDGTSRVIHVMSYMLRSHGHSKALKSSYFPLLPNKENVII